MSELQKDDDVTQKNSSIDTSTAFNHLVTEMLVLGDKLNAAAGAIHEKARHRTAIVGVAIIMFVLHVFVLKWMPETVSGVLIDIVAVWVVYNLTHRFLRLFNAEDAGYVAIQVLSSSTLFVCVSTALQREYTVFVKMLELTKTTGDSLYHSGILTELRWQTVKLHLSRYGI
jgi:hypothetical protein